MAYAATNRSHQEPFTMYPNRYTDIIKPRLTDTQKAVIDAVIRLTTGWHRDSAHISNSKLCAITGKTEPAIIRAKKKLIDIGLLVVIKHGGGSTTGVYALDLYYDTPERSARVSVQRHVSPLGYSTSEDVTTAMSCPPGIDVPPTADHKVSITSPCTGMVTSAGDVMQKSIADEPFKDDQAGIATPAAVINSGQPQAPGKDIGTNTREETPEAVVTSDRPAPALSTELSDPTDALKPVSTDVNDTPTPNAVLAPCYPRCDDINKNKQAPDDAKNTSTMPRGDAGTNRNAVATVRYEFLKLFPEAAEGDDWPLFGWATKEHGAERCLDKLQLLREFRKGRTIVNPKGLFRMALVKDYQPSAWIKAKLLADEKARRAIERSCQEAQRREEIRANIDYEAGKVALQKIVDMLNSLDLQTGSKDA